MSKHYYSALSVLVLGAIVLLSTPAKQPLPANKNVTLVVNGYELQVQTTAADVAGLLLAEVGDYSEMSVSPEPAHQLVAGDVITVTDSAVSGLSKVVAQNFQTATAPPPPPAEKPKPKPKAASSPKPKPVVEAAIDKPVPQVYSGLATWYRHGGGLTTASRDFPRGTKLHVVAVNSGKSVDVVVDDYGPSAATGNALDLDAAAFQALAPLGAGKIAVKYYRQ